MRDSLRHSRFRTRLFMAIALLSFLASANAQSQPAAGEAPGPDENPPVPKKIAAGDFRTVSWKTLFPNLLDDQRRIWTFPAGLAKGKHWIPALTITGVTAGLVALDPHDAPYFRRTDSFSGFNQILSGTATGLGTGAAPASFYLVGLARHDVYAQQTGLFGGEALADALIVDAVLKGITQRYRPSAILPNGNFSNTWFKTGWGSAFNGTASFPSGHSIAAFAVATVIARRYGNHRWVPWVSYGLAGLVGFSRVTNQAHFPSDVFMGAALGYCISRFAVLRH